MCEVGRAGAYVKVCVKREMEHALTDFVSALVAARTCYALIFDVTVAIGMA